MQKELAAPSAEPIADWKESAQSLAKSLGKAATSALLRGAIVVGLSLGLNLGFALVFFASSGLVGGLGGLAGIAISLVCFAPFVLFAVGIAQKRGAMRLAAAAVESQGPSLARIGTHYLGSFVRERYGDIGQSRVGSGFDKGWKQYLKSRKESSRVVRFIIAGVTSRIPIGKTVDALAEQGIPSDRVPEDVMRQAIAHMAREQLRAGWTPLLLLFGTNILWFFGFTFWVWPAIR